jgi:biopolymer transport protein ExbB
MTRNSLPTPDAITKLASGSLLGAVLASGLRAAVSNPRIERDSLKHAFESAGKVAVHQLERYLNTLGTIASAAPLLGLLGTVVGMIEIFGSQAPGGGNPEQLAHGISIALYNTAFGLIIAIPTLMLYRYFRGKVDEYAVELEQSADVLLSQLERLKINR